MAALLSMIALYRKAGKRELSDAVVARFAESNPGQEPGNSPVLLVQGLDDVVGVRQVDHAAAHQRSRLAGAVLHRPHPGEAELGDVLPGQLVQRAPPPAVPGAADHQPIRGGGQLRMIPPASEHEHLSFEVSGRQERLTGIAGGAKAIPGVLG